MARGTTTGRNVTTTEIDWRVRCFRCSKRSVIVNPFIAPPGFDLRRRLWSTLNYFRTGQGRCAANLVRWNQASDPSCFCGAASQTMSRIVNDCPDTKFFGVWQSYIWLMRRLLPGSACRAYPKRKTDLVYYKVLCTQHKSCSRGLAMKLGTSFV